jgi:hypothetical protein
LIFNNVEFISKHATIVQFTLNRHCHVLPPSQSNLVVKVKFTVEFLFQGPGFARRLTISNALDSQAYVSVMDTNDATDRATPPSGHVCQHNGTPAQQAERGTEIASGGSKWQSDLVTAGESRLLDQIPTKYARFPWLTDDKRVIMPSYGTTTTTTSTKKKLIRPSSAEAKLQTHPSYETGLFDNNVVAKGFLPYNGSSPSIDADPIGRPLLPRRPKTHVGGPRFWSRSRTPVAGSVQAATDPAAVRKSRRLTLTGTEGISDEDLANRRRLLNQFNRNERIKGKVGRCRTRSHNGV